MAEDRKNSELTEEEKQALLMDHVRKIQAQNAIIKREQDERKRLKRLAKADGILSKDIDFAIRVLEVEDENIIPDELRRMTQIAAFLGQPLNFQAELFEDRRPAEERIKSEGFTAGMQRKDESPYEKNSQEDHWWREGQAAGHAKQDANLKAAMDKQLNAAAEEAAAKEEAEKAKEAPMPIAEEAAE